MAQIWRGRCHPATKWITVIIPAAITSTFVALLQLPLRDISSIKWKQRSPNDTLVWRMHSLLLYRICRLLARKRPPAWKPVVDDQRSICSAIFKASSTSIPRYRTVLSNLVCPRRSWTARRLPVFR